MNKLGAKHTNVMNSVIYLPRARGRRGLRSLERTYKELKIKTAVKLLNENEKRMKVVKRFHKLNMQSASYSIFKDAKLYANELQLNLDITDNEYVIHYEDVIKVTEKDTTEIDVISKEIIRKRNDIYQTDICNSTWQGVNS